MVAMTGTTERVVTFSNNTGCPIRDGLFIYVARLLPLDALDAVVDESRRRLHCDRITLQMASER